MDESTKTSPCKECKEDGGVDLHAELEHLRQHLAERDAHILALEGDYLKYSNKSTELEEQVTVWREKYERLYDSHKRVQTLNQILEDKLLQMVDKMKGEKTVLTKDIATLSVRLAESKHSVGTLQKENERYKNDMNLAIQLLQCKPDNFVSQKLDNLPVDTQARVSQYVMAKTKSSASVQSKNPSENETFDTNEYEFNISASLMSKILEDSVHDTITKHCDTCTCSKTQNKPFSYDESYYSVSTQTTLTGETTNSCTNCNENDYKSVPSNISIRNPTAHVNHVNEKSAKTPPVYVNPLTLDNYNGTREIIENIYCNLNADKLQPAEALNIEPSHDVVLNEMGQEIKYIRKTINMEPGVHHKLCERTRLSISSNKGSEISGNNEELSMRDTKAKSESIAPRKTSQSSMGAMSRASSVAKSTSSAQKSNTQVGPGPRFCSLRVQAGSKNILLDNAQPDVPPVLYKRQSKCTESVFKEGEAIDSFLNLDKNIIDVEGRGNVVAESTLIDVHVDNNNKDSTSSRANSINPILMNVSSSPLQPLKTHSYSNSSEKNNNSFQNNGSQKGALQIDNVIIDNNNLNDNDKLNLGNGTCGASSKNETPKTETHDIQIFNFDRYEQNIMASQYTKSLKKIDMSQLHTIEYTKISKDLPPQGDIPKKFNIAKPIPAVVNVYPNITQTHLKVNEATKVFTNEQSTSSLSSDDSAALLQKQQLLRVAEWVEKNLEQQTTLTDPVPLEEDLAYINKAAQRDKQLHRLTDTLEMALRMPHPVSKYANEFTEEEGSGCILKNFIAPNKTEPEISQMKAKLVNANNIGKETVFPVDALENNVTTETKIEPSYTGGDMNSKTPRDKEVTPEELARMEYNVKKFLLSGPMWGTHDGRSRRTSSKTETDV